MLDLVKHLTEQQEAIAMMRFVHSEKSLEKERKKFGLLHFTFTSSPPADAFFRLFGITGRMSSAMLVAKNSTTQRVMRCRCFLATWL